MIGKPDRIRVLAHPVGKLQIAGKLIFRHTIDSTGLKKEIQTIMADDRQPHSRRIRCHFLRRGIIKHVRSVIVGAVFKDCLIGFPIRINTWPVRTGTGINAEPIDIGKSEDSTVFRDSVTFMENARPLLTRQVIHGAKAEHGIKSMIGNLCKIGRIPYLGTYVFKTGSRYFLPKKLNVFRCQIHSDIFLT